jgi:hypothetical protein
LKGLEPFLAQFRDLSWSQCAYEQSRARPEGIAQVAVFIFEPLDCAFMRGDVLGFTFESLLRLAARSLEVALKLVVVGSLLSEAFSGIQQQASRRASWRSSGLARRDAFNVGGIESIDSAIVYPRMELHAFHAPHRGNAFAEASRDLRPRHHAEVVASQWLHCRRDMPGHAASACRARLETVAIGGKW